MVVNISRNRRIDVKHVHPVGVGGLKLSGVGVVAHAVETRKLHVHQRVGQFRCGRRGAGHAAGTFTDAELGAKPADDI